MGPAAARARGVDLTWLGLSGELDVAPAPTNDNLTTLAEILGGVDPRLRAHDKYAIALNPEIFRSIPTLPLTTRLGDVNILLRPTGSPTNYDDLRDDASTVQLDTVPTLVPTIHALLRGLAGGARQPHPEVIAQLRQLAEPEPQQPAVVAEPLAAGDHRNLEEAVLNTLSRIGHPATIRDVLFSMQASQRPPYKQVKAAAESLTARGLLLRDKEGAAHRYRLNTAADDKIAHQVAALLRSSLDLDGTIARALKLIDSETDARTTADSSDPGATSET